MRKDFKTGSQLFHRLFCLFVCLWNFTNMTTPLLFSLQYMGQALSVLQSHMITLCYKFTCGILKNLDKLNQLWDSNTQYKFTSFLEGEIFILRQIKWNQLQKGVTDNLTKPEFIIQHILYNSVNRNPRTPCHCFCTLIWLTFLDLAKTGRIRFLPIVKTKKVSLSESGSEQIDSMCFVVCSYLKFDHEIPCGLMSKTYFWLSYKFKATRALFTTFGQLFWKWRKSKKLLSDFKDYFSGLLRLCSDLMKWIFCFGKVCARFCSFSISISIAKRQLFYKRLQLKQCETVHQSPYI